MKPFYFLVALAMTLAFFSCQSDDSVEDICASMDDEVFKNYCYEHFDTNKDGELSQEEADAVRSIDISGLNVRSLKGIEHFANLERIKAKECEHLREVVIPNTVSSIGDSAFSNCDNLKSITIPDGVTSIGKWVFYNCYNLTSVTILKSVTSIGKGAFYNCNKLTSITIPDGVTSIGDSAFSNCDNLKSITIPDGVTTIGDDAFFHCENLKSVTIPKSVTSIGDSTFYNCDKLTSITIPDGVTSIGDWTFGGCDNLTSFYGKFASADNRCLIVDGVLIAFAPAGLTEYTIPDGVTSIGEGAFCECDKLTSITIPDGVTSIGDGAFFYCKNLKSITIPDGVTSIGDWTFGGCDNLTSFYGKFASADNRCLIVDGVLIAFAPAGLTEYTIPDGVTSIGEGAFCECDKLTSITIPDGVTAIGNRAFGDCKNLTSVTIPDGVTAIGNGAFSFCKNLRSVYCKATTPPTGDSDMFDNNASGRKIYVSMNSVEAYKVANKWKEYADDIVGYDF